MRSLIKRISPGSVDLLENAVSDPGVLSSLKSVIRDCWSFHAGGRPSSPNILNRLGFLHETENLEATPVPGGSFSTYPMAEGKQFPIERMVKQCLNSETLFHTIGASLNRLFLHRDSTPLTIQDASRSNIHQVRTVSGLPLRLNQYPKLTKKIFPFQLPTLRIPFHLLLRLFCITLSHRTLWSKQSPKVTKSRILLPFLLALGRMTTAV